MPFWCYILRCADGRYYTGHTDNLERRVAEHRAGGYCKFTSTRLPVWLAWCQEFPSRLEALEAERRISPWSRRKKDALIASDWKALSYWAKPPSERSSASIGSPAQGPSTSLGTNGDGMSDPRPLAQTEIKAPSPNPFVPSEVEAPPRL